MSVRVSVGNTKLGRIPNISLTPILTCPSNIPCRTLCYAMRAYRQYPNVRTAWDTNLEICRRSQTEYFDGIAAWLSSKKKSVRYFRWHVAGDIPDDTYLCNMIDLACDFPKTKFMAFSKQHDILHRHYRKAPKNLILRASLWTCWGKLRDVKGLAKAWFQDVDHSEKRIPDNARVCPGSCITCKRCWTLPKNDVVLMQH